MRFFGSTVLTASLLVSTAAFAQTADKLFTNGAIYTVNETQPWAEAIAVEGNKIVYVGDNAGAEAFKSDTTEVFDLDGKMMLPGFFSGHEHLISSLWTSQGAVLTGGSKEDTIAQVKEWADANPDAPFVLGQGWNAALMDSPPTAADLDAVFPDRPVILLDFTIHDAWWNSKAMEMGGVTKDTPDAVPGLTFWVRDENGTPTGYGKEFAWMPAYVAAGAWKPETMIPDSLEQLYADAAAQGMTGYINQGLVTPNITNLEVHTEDAKVALKILAELEAKDELKLRTFLQTMYKTEDTPVEDIVRITTELKDQYHSDQVAVSGIKIHPEGVFASHASEMLEPFTDKPDIKPVRGVSAERVDEVVMKGNAAGHDVSVHTDGSATNRATIDTFIKAKEKGFGERRNSLQHYGFVHPDDQKRVIEHKIPINLTPLWGTAWGGGLDSALQVMGEARTNTYFQQIRTAVDGGVPVSIGADVPSSPVTFAGALWQCESALTRVDPTSDDPREFPPEDQALTLEQCLYTATMGGAYQAWMEDKVGSIEVGKYADLVILADNLFEIEPNKIADTKVHGTLMDGRFTHREGL